MYNRAQKYPEAIQDCLTSVELDPSYPDAYCELGFLYKKTNVMNNPKSIFFWRHRASLYWEIGEHDKAISDLTVAIELNPLQRTSYNNRGWVYYELGEYKKALEDFTRAIELDPNAPDAKSSYKGRATTYDELGDSAKAMEDLNKVP
eukprot:GEZU01023246.1.p2 GENE.GEZU01023246.1~~GEZU01023246.1.p2  ORF type:complete len:147 (-),score=32.67 GEZU01023246.1:49-489(-)